MKIETNGETVTVESRTGNKQWFARISGRHPKYNLDRDFLMYQKPATAERDDVHFTPEEGDLFEAVEFTHSGKNRRRDQLLVWNGEEFDEVERDEVDEVLPE